jgi:hypothetical protein
MLFAHWTKLLNLRHPLLHLVLIYRGTHSTSQQILAILTLWLLQVRPSILLLSLPTILLSC